MAVTGLVMVAAGGAGAAVRIDQGRSDRLLAGVTVMGVDVGDMNRAAAVAAVRQRISEVGQRAVEVSVSGERTRVSLADLGVSGDAEDAVNEAFAKISGLGVWRRTWLRHQGGRAGISVDVLLSPSPQAEADAARRLAGAAERAPQDARLEVVDGKLVLHPDVPGQHVEASAAATLLDSAARALLAGGGASSPVDLPVSRLAPGVTSDAFPVAIVIRVDEQELDYYEKGSLAHEFPVASGQYGYDTPLGDFRVDEKIRYPSWYNPAPTTWGKSMPLVIGPGPGNPLGTHAIGINSPGIFLHETLGGVGYRASHGCVRMQPDDLQSFFEDIPLGAPVLIMEGPETYTPHVSPPSGDASSADTSPAGASV